jgi:hypothetical protein
LWLNSPDLDAFSFFYQLRDTTWNVRGWETPRVRFLLPISVRTGKLVEEPERPIETTVR